MIGKFDESKTTVLVLAGLKLADPGVGLENCLPGGCELVDRFCADVFGVAKNKKGMQERYKIVFIILTVQRFCYIYREPSRFRHHGYRWQSILVNAAEASGRFFTHLFVLYALFLRVHDLSIIQPLVVRQLWKCRHQNSKRNFVLESYHINSS